MIIVKLLSPKYLPSSKDNWTWRHKFTYFLLKRLLNIYVRGVSSDTFYLGKVQIIHTVRDVWFEREIERYHISIKNEMSIQSIPYENERSIYHSFIFNWEDTLSIIDSTKHYILKLGNNISVKTNIEGVFSAARDFKCFHSSKFMVEMSQQNKNEPQPNNQQPRKEPEKKPENKPEKKQPVKSNPLGREKREPKPKPKQPQRPQQQEQPKTPIVNNNGNDSNTIKRGKINIDLTF